MRIDKYLWCTRYYKTRSIATEACKKGHIKLNGSNVKPSKDVFPVKKLPYERIRSIMRYGVIDVPANRVGAKLVDLYRKDITPKEAFENQDLLKVFKRLLSKKRYRKAYQKGP